ncbi:MAG: hypothetical protein H6813_02125 [Phycisphaeraceae bacterium]|nr:hypothetical protein [Phycisphaeraceae bacterium]
MSSRTHLITLLTTLAITPPISLAGDLNPPGGPVAPSMRTLDEVEPRTIVNDTNTPGDATATYVISQPGSYYLTGDVNGVFGMHGIRIDARGVTLDLNGFAVVLNQINLRGAPPTVNGINATPIPLLDGAIVIRNGRVRGWLNGVSLNGQGAIQDISAVANSAAGIIAIDATIERCTVEFNDVGIAINNGAVTDCLSRSSFGQGFSGAQAALTRCVSTNNVEDGFLFSAGSVLRDCTASANTENGFNISSASTAMNCASTGNMGSGFQMLDSTASDCQALTNSNSGFLVSGSSALRDCLSQGNTLHGYNVTLTGGGGPSPVSFSGCVARQNLGSSGFTTIAGCDFRGCSSSSNSIDGFNVGDHCVFIDCSAQSNGDDGFQFGQASTLQGCVSARNDYGFFAPSAGVGSTGSRIDSNTASDNNVIGFLIGADNCVVVRNVAQNNGADYNVNPIAQLGDIVTSIGFVGNVGPWVNFGTPTIGLAAPPSHQQLPPGKR